MLTGIQIAQRAKDQISALTGLKTDTVSAISKRDDGWEVRLEIVEMSRIPDSTDMLATYRALLDSEGILLSYERMRRYRRDQVMDEND